MANRMSVEGSVQPKSAAKPVVPVKAPVAKSIFTPDPKVAMNQAQAAQRLAAPKPAPVYAPPPPPTPPTYPGQADPYSSINVSANQAPPVVPKIDPNVEYLNEAGYIAQVGALKSALDNFNAQDTADRQRYDVDFDSGLRDLGFRDNTPDITTDNLDDLNNGARNWDWNDVLSASGRGYQQNVNDFASRGMLQSQGYADSIDNLKRSLETQRDSMATGRTTFKQGKTDAATNYGVQDTAARNAAKIDAIARLSAQLGIG